MKHIKDQTGRFALRPYYEDNEIENECEQTITSFMVKRYGEITYPIPTDALIRLIERDTDDLDLYSDLALDEGVDVHGVTDFFPGKKPKVRIERMLTEDKTEHRLRTTLTHEHFHVKSHAYLYDAKAQDLSLFSDIKGGKAAKCHRDNITGSGRYDWMEWQAGFASVAMLVPSTHLCKVVTDFHERHQLFGQLTIGTVPAGNLTRLVSKLYQVSIIAAENRLLQRGFITRENANRKLLR